jgi:hypothetical protein
MFLLGIIEIGIVLKNPYIQQITENSQNEIEMASAGIIESPA